MNLTTIFSRLWSDYARQNPSADKIYDLFWKEGESVVNDHIAFRTLDLPQINIDAVALPFVENGYEPAGEYFFTDKHLFARHYELPGDDNAPRIFISQLILDDSSPYVRKVFHESFRDSSVNLQGVDNLIFAGTIFNPISFKVYNRLREDSEYAAWFYAFGFRANHFTVSVNSLKKYNTIFKVNELLKRNGFILNSSGGEVKGSPSDLLQQSSIMADLVSVGFEEGNKVIPSCYYEFAQRFPGADGRLFSGFIAGSADKIFESTDYYTKA